VRATEQSYLVFARMIYYVTSCPDEAALPAGLDIVFQRQAGRFASRGLDGRALFVSDARRPCAVADNGAGTCG